MGVGGGECGGDGEELEGGVSRALGGRLGEGRRKNVRFMELGEA